MFYLRLLKKELVDMPVCHHTEHQHWKVHRVLGLHRALGLQPQQYLCLLIVNFIMVGPKYIPYCRSTFYISILSVLVRHQ
jgi:hypothetical protein